MVKEIPLISSKHPNRVALVDDEDYDSLIKYKWNVRFHNRNYYAYRCEWDKVTKRMCYLYMARVIMGTPKGREVDHIDHDELNCQKYNMRECSHIQNTQNARKCISKLRNITSKYKGVSFKNTYRGKKKWRATIRVNGKDKFLGMYKTEREAALAYDEAAIKYYKEFAHTNFEG